MRRGGRLVGYTQRRVCGECGAVGQVTYEPGEPVTWDYPGSAAVAYGAGCAHAANGQGEWACAALLQEAEDRQVEAAEAEVEAAIDRMREEGGRQGNRRLWDGTRGDRWDD